MNVEEETFTLCPQDTSVLKSHLPVGLPEKDSQVAYIIRTVAFELESRGANIPLGGTMAAVKGVLIVHLPAELGGEQQELRVAKLLASEEGRRWRWEVREPTFPLAHIPYFRGKRLIWLCKELIKRQPTSQCLVLHCRIYSQGENVFLTGQRLVSSLTN